MIIEEVKKSETETIEDCDIDVEASTHKLPYDLSKIEGMFSEVVSGKTLNDEQTKLLSNLHEVTRPKSNPVSISHIKALVFGLGHGRHSFEFYKS